MDHDLRTKIVSIDPQPRSTIDDLCDEVIRLPLEDCPLSTFTSLEAGSIVLCDNSHRAFQNSDVTVFLTEIMPELMGREILVGIHDIYLPYDSPEEWLQRQYNEQYLLVGYIPGSMDTVLPNHFCISDAALRNIVSPLLDSGPASSASKGAGMYWFKS